MDKFVIIDGNSLINRAFYALPPLMNKDGTPTQAVYGFATMLIKAINDIKPKYLAVAFDMRAPTFRHKLYDQYKGTRKGMPDELAVQMPILKDMLSQMGITTIEKETFEADDIIGTMAKKCKCETYIVTGDRDALQLIDDKVSVMLTKRGLSDILFVDEEEIVKEFKLTPSQVIDYKALSGDSSDNIPGVAGVGDKTAMSLLENYKTLDGIYENIDKIGGKLNERLVSGKDMAYLSYKLATIDTKMDIDCEAENCTYNFPFKPQLKNFFIDMGFKTLVKKDEIFQESGTSEVVNSKDKKPTCETVVIENLEDLNKAIQGDFSNAAIFVGESVHIAFGSAKEYIVNITFSLIDMGIDYNQVAIALTPLLKNNKIQKIFYDAKDFKKLTVFNKIDIQNYFDVKLAQYLVDMTIEYDTIKKLLSSYEIDEREVATGLIYIAGELMKQIESLDMHSLYYGIELKLVDILYRMEKVGFCVDLKRLDELGQEFMEKAKILADEIFKISGQQFNINSPKQLLKVLFEDMKIPYPIKGKNQSTSADVLELLVLDYPIAQKILDYRFYTKLNGTYVDGMKKLTDSNNIVHTEFKQTLTSTGRLSSVEPNLQNIPVRQEEGKALRSAFVASGNNVLVSADYSQIELRLMAHLSDDKTMLAAYKNLEDIHTTTAAQVFGVDKKDVTNAMRREAKAVNFGIIYGISDYGLATNLKISPHKAKEYIEKYFSRFVGVKEYLDRSVKDAKEKGYAITLFGRRRKIPELYSSNYNTRQFGERVAMNMPLQGAAADIIKIAMVNVDNALKGMKSKLILQIHDELIIDTDPSEIEEVKAILNREMPGAANLKIPLSVEVGMGKNWLECK